jgi:hypothetical protein
MKEYNDMKGLKEMMKGNKGMKIKINNLPLIQIFLFR